jgi:uncharacterized protein (DUF1697 family)
MADDGLQAGWTRVSEGIHIVLFRGVGGKTQLPTAPLRAALTDAGFRQVATYIATGNVVLASDLRPQEVGAQVAAIAAERFGFTKPTMVLTHREWKRLIARNPFPEAVHEPTRLHAFVLEAQPSRGAGDALLARATAGERLVLDGKVLYLHTPEGFGTSKLPPLIDRTLGVASTARNWNTVRKLDELAAQAAQGLRREHQG